MKEPQLKTVVKTLFLTAPLEVLNHGPLSSISNVQADITDFPEERYVIVRSRDPRMKHAYLVIPYGAIRGIRKEVVSASEE